jgi:hypothetical protein
MTTPDNESGGGLDGGPASNAPATPSRTLDPNSNLSSGSDSTPDTDSV